MTSSRDRHTSYACTPRWIACLTWAALVIVLGLGGLCVAIEPPAAAQKKPDWAGLDSLLAAGDYEKAAATAGEIAAQLEPNRRDTDFFARSIGFVRARIRQGLAELRLGQLDAATRTLEQAYRALKDSNFKRFVTLQERNPNAQAMSTLVLLDLTMIELLELRMAVLVDRLHVLNLGLQPPAAPKSAADPAAQTQVEECLKDLGFLEKNAADAREALAERFAQAGQTILDSPHYQSLASSFRPSLLAGLKALEVARLAAAPGATDARGQPPTAGEGAARPSPEDALRSFQDAGAALDKAIAAAAPKGATTMKPAARIEAALLRAELLTAEGRARLAAADPARARECFTKAIELRQEASVLLKLPKPAEHPDLFRLLLLSAEAALDTARDELRSGDPTRARRDVDEAAKLLARADRLPLPPDHPLRKLVGDLQTRIDADESTVVAKTPRADAADAAARQLQHVIDRTPFLGSAGTP